MKKPAKWTKEEWRYFEAFNTSNKSSPHHPLDCRKWNAFVIEAHKNRTKLSRDDVRSAMKKSGWSDDWSDSFADCFEEYRELLAMYDAI